MLTHLCVNKCVNTIKKFTLMNTPTHLMRKIFKYWEATQIKHFPKF